MNGVEKIRSRLGGNIRDSMTVGGADAPPIAPPAADAAASAKYEGAARVRDALAIRLDRLEPDPDQPRKEFDDATIDDLAESLKSRGQLQSIRARWDEGRGRWVVVSGERRYRAALRAGLGSLLCVEVAGRPTADDLLEDQLVENCLREDLRPIERARAYRTLMDRKGLSTRRLAETLRISHTSIAKAVALLDLPEGVRDLVDADRLPAATAYAIGRVEGADAQEELAGLAADGKVTRDRLETLVRSAARKKPARPPAVVTFRLGGGRKVVVEGRKGLDDAAVVAALAEALAAAEGKAARGRPGAEEAA